MLSAVTVMNYGQEQHLNSKLSSFDRHFGCASYSCLQDSLGAVPRGPCRYQVGKVVWVCLVLSILKEAESCSTDGLWKR